MTIEAGWLAKLNSAPPGSRCAKCGMSVSAYGPDGSASPTFIAASTVTGWPTAPGAHEVERPQRHRLEAVVEVLNQEPSGLQRGVAHRGVVLAPSGDWLLDEHVRTAPERQLHELPVRGGWREDVHGVRLELREHPFRVGAGVGHAEPLGDRGRERRRQVAHPHDLRVVDPVQLAEVGVGDPAEPDKNHAHRRPPVSRVGKVHRREPGE